MYPPSKLHENKFVTDFREKAKILNSFFAKKFSLINSDSFLPSELKTKMDNSLYSLRFSTEDILKINNLDSRLIVTMRLVLECWKNVVSPSLDH